MEKVDIKDKQILYNLNKDCRQSNSSLAKKMGTSKEVVAYRIKRLEEKRLITGYYTSINSIMLGFTYGRIYAKFRGFDEQDMDKIIRFCKLNKEIGFICPFYGDFDFSITIRTKTLLELKRIEDKFFEFFGDKIINSTLMMGVKFKGYALNHLIDGHNHKELISDEESEDNITLDKMDKKILTILSKNPRISIVTIANKLELTANAISYRIKNMIKNNIIEAFKATINMDKLGFTRFRILFYFGACSVEQKNKIITYLGMYNRVIFLSEYLGTSNLELIVHFESINKVYEFLRKLGQQFPKAIKDFKVLVMGKTNTVNAIDYLNT